ncbi:MAG: flavin reductase family protein [Hyphomicrobiales bacterium]
MRTINPKEVKLSYLHQILLSSIAPRPIAFASTIDKDGIPNLSPFSFFNAFGINPTTLIFSPARRGRNNTTKDTFENVKVIPEVVINTVSYDIAHQASLSSCEYDKSINEFVKAGFTPIPSETIRPFRVKESPVQFECIVRDIIETGDQGGAGNLVICEITRIHIHTNILDNNDMIDINKIDLVGRLGQNYYCRTSNNSNFTIPKPNIIPGIGIDALPPSIKHSRFLTGTDLGKIGNLTELPSKTDIEKVKQYPKVQEAINSPHPQKELHTLAKSYLEANDIELALSILMIEF